MQAEPGKAEPGKAEAMASGLFPPTALPSAETSGFGSVGNLSVTPYLLNEAIPALEPGNPATCSTTPPAAYFVGAIILLIAGGLALVPWWRLVD